MNNKEIKQLLELDAKARGKEHLTSEEINLWNELEFKRNKPPPKRNIINNNDIKTDDQLNELILYIFTGFFLLVLYDNIYRLGKKSY